LEIIHEEKDIMGMVGELTNDLSDPEQLRAISRVPEPKAGLRYREILRKLYISLGSFQASVIIEFKDGLRKHYVFIVKAIPDESKESIAECRVYAEGYILEKKPNRGVTYRIFKSATLSSVDELYKIISEVGDKFRWSDIKIYLKKIMEYDDYFWL